MKGRLRKLRTGASSLREYLWPQTGSGRGGTFGTPTAVPEEASPETDQEANWVVSGGGLVGPTSDNGEPHDAARRQVG